MTDQRSPIATYRPSIDYGARPAGTKPEGPAPSFRETVGASFTLGQAERTGDDEQAVIDAYGAPVAELTRRGAPISRYVFAGRGGGNPVNEYAVWRDIAAARARDPQAFADLPADRRAFRAKVGADYRADLSRAAEVSDRGGLIGNLVGGFGAALTDPINVGTAFVSGGGSTLARRIASEALVNAGTELLQQPLVAQQRAKTGRTLTGGEAAMNVASAGLLGGAVPLAGALGRRVATPAGEAVKRLIERVGADRLTPEERGAARTLQAEDDALQSNPYGPGGAERHLRRLNAEKSAIAGYRTVADAPDRPISTETVADARARERASVANLTPDRIIRFVMHDLEGGDATVRYSDADGGTTKFGIAAKFHPGVDVANLTEEGAARISRDKYWSPAMDQIDPRVAAVLFDAKFLGGARAFEKVSRAAREGSWANALATYRAHLSMIADTVPGKERYRKGWMNRVDRLEAFIDRNGGDGDMPVLRRADFDPDEEGAGQWRAAQEEVEAAERALDAADAEAARASAPPRLLDDDDDIPFDLDDPRARVADGEQRDPFAHLEEEPTEPVGRAIADDSYVASRRGDFYEITGETAARAGRALEMPVTRNAAGEPTIALPAHAAERYIEQIKSEGIAVSLAGEEPRPGRLADDALPEDGATGTMHGYWNRLVDRGEDPPRLFAMRSTGGEQPVGFVKAWSIDRADIDRWIADADGGWEAVRIEPAAASREARGKAERAVADQFADGPEPQAPPAALDGYDSAADAGAQEALDSLEHDLRMLADAEPGATALDENGDVVSVADLLAGWDAEEAEVAAMRACLTPGGAG